jgi:F0F1-type ATP synthase membrane subunit a
MVQNILLYLFTVFLYILTANLPGLVPFSFATTAQLVVAFGLSFSLIYWCNFNRIIGHKTSFLSFFYLVVHP